MAGLAGVAGEVARRLGVAAVDSVVPTARRLAGLAGVAGEVARRLPGGAVAAEVAAEVSGVLACKVDNTTLSTWNREKFKWLSTRRALFVISLEIPPN